MKLIFVDRDGVINKDPGGWTKYNYVTDIKDFHFLPGALEALKLLNGRGIRVVIVSNQAGVGKGYFSKAKLEKVNNWMLAEVKKSGGVIEEACYCIHKDEDNCNCRKPKTGMLEAAMKKYGITVSDTYMIGDSQADVMAGKLAGMKTIFVLSGKASLEDAKKWEEKPDYIFNNLLEAVKWIAGKDKRKADRAIKRRESERKR